MEKHPCYCDKFGKVDTEILDRLLENAEIKQKNVAKISKFIVEHRNDRKWKL